jgi:hypothetical protein
MARRSKPYLPTSNASSELTILIKDKKHKTLPHSQKDWANFVRNQLPISRPSMHECSTLFMMVFEKDIVNPHVGR